jgi:hypothetical protein
VDIDKYLKEETSTGGYPSDGTGISGDDDLPTGTGVFGDKYVPEMVPNRLTGATKRYAPSTEEWNWNEFENSTGMGSQKNYSETLDSMVNLFGERFWAHTTPRGSDKLQKDKEALRKQADGDQNAKLGKDSEESAPEPEQKEVSEMDILSKIDAHLYEADLAPADRRNITKAIIGGKSMKINIKNMKLDVKINDTKNGTTFEYPNNTDFTLALVDISDTLGMEFEQKSKGTTTVFTIKG